MEPSSIRYLALGDSFTIGTGTTPDKAFPALLAGKWRAAGRAVELLNPAVNGYTTDELITRELPHVAVFRPTFVTLLIGANDIVRGTGVTAPARRQIEQRKRNVDFLGVKGAGGKEQLGEEVIRWSGAKTSLSA